MEKKSRKSNINKYYSNANWDSKVGGVHELAPYSWISIKLMMLMIKIDNYIPGIRSS
jgi:hypothetical protein